MAFESVGDNPHLANFYGNMPPWSFHLQIFFLGHRPEQHRGLALAPESAFCDRSLFEDYYIFARALRALGSLSERDYRAFERLFQWVVNSLPGPDLLLFLKASTPTLLSRIRGPGRAIEAGITTEYLDLLNRLYADWLASFDLCPALSLPSSFLQPFYTRAPSRLHPPATIFLFRSSDWNK
jgi:deoxyadenosine/deoxycytidine kinase